MNKTSEEYARELDAAERRFREGFTRWQQEREAVSPLAQFPLRALTWLALAPEWPLGLAEQGFPAVEGLASGEAVGAQLAAIYDARVCQSADSDDGRGRIFWMNPAQQSSVLELLKKLPDDGLMSSGLRNFLRQQLSEASAAMERASATGRALNAPLRRWIELARSAETDDGLAKLLRDKVEQAITGAEQSRQVVSPEALRWIKAAKPFVEWFGEPVEWAVAQTSRRLELFYRRAYDERSLKNYYQREGQERAFEELMEGADEGRPPGSPERPWALHYVGLGGAGKTMLLRHISAQVAKAKNLAVARVDFDRLNPDYPSRAPGLLLMSFAEELRPFAAEVGSDVFQRFDKEVDLLHERISSSFRSGAPRTVEVDDSEFQLVLDLFTSAVNRLFEKKRGVVLILDTCEELARIRSDNTLPDSVHVTFDILERIHRRVDRLRVVFSGRRPLARAGHVLGVSPEGEKSFAWTCPASKLPERDYLRLYEIHGFRRREALEFLSLYEGEAEDGGGKTHVNPELFEAIVRQSCSADKNFDSRFELRGGSANDAGGPEPRYTPFELDMFARWATCEPDLTEREINAGANHYVRERIIKRADHRVRDVLPVVTLLGRFDEALIRRLVEEQGGDADIVFPELIQSELLDVDRNASESGTVWVMDGIMRKRLRKFYDEEKPQELVAATRTLARVMYDHTLARGWEELSPAYFVTAFDVLVPDRARAARWWSEVEVRLAREAQWVWAKIITEELLAEGGPAARADAALGREAAEESALRPAILATQAAASTHLLFTDPRADRRGLHALWAEVAEKADRHPTVGGALLLKRRGVAGMAAALRWQTDVPEDTRVNDIIELWEQLPQLPPAGPAVEESAAASELAMLESLVEVAEGAASAGRDSSAAELGRKLNQFYERHIGSETSAWRESSPTEFNVFRLTLHARLQKLCGRHGEALETFRCALDSLRKLDPARFGPALQRWPDWHQPDDILARVALEYARHVGSTYDSIKSTLARLNEVVGSPSPSATPPHFRGATLDNERLASARLQLRAHETAAGAGYVWDDESIASSVALQGVETYCNAHRAFPPFFVTALDAGCGAGRIDAAVAKLGELSRKGHDWSSYVNDEAERALLIVAGRMRLNDEKGGYDLRPGVGIPPGRLGQPDPDALIEALNVRPPEWIVGSASRAGGALQSFLEASLHARWRCRGVQSGVEVKKFYQPGAVKPWAGFNEFSLALDGLESHLISQGGESDNLSHSFRDLALACAAWARGNPTRKVEALTLCLRTVALMGGRGPKDFLGATRKAGGGGDTPREIGDLLPFVGRRRAAEIAFEEGTLLALRLPQQALELLKFAHVWYGDADDGPHRLLAAIRLSMAYAQLGREEGMRFCVDAAGEAYSGLRKLDSSLPRWEELGAATEGPAGAPLLELIKRLEQRLNWRPWLVRLLGCIVLARPSGSRADNLRALRQFVTDNYGADVGGRRETPPEFQFLFTQVKQSFTERLKTTYWALVSYLAGLKKAAYFILGLGFSLLLVYGVSRFIQYVASFFSPITMWESFGLLLAFFMVGLMLPRIMRAYTSLVLTSLTRGYSVTSEGGAVDANRPLLSTLRLAPLAPLKVFAGKGLVIEPAPTHGAGGSAETPGSGPYRELSRALPERARKWLEWERTRVGNRYIRYKFVVHDSSAAAPLEAIFQLASEKIEDFGQTRLLCWRDVPVRSSWPAGPPVNSLRVMTVASTLSHVDMARTAWGRAFAGTDCLHLSESPGSLPKAVTAGVCVVNLFGKPLDMNGKLALDLGETEMPSYRLPSLTDEPRSSGLGIRVTAADIAQRFPDLKICVIQLPPTSDATRDASSRYEAGLLRRLGANLSARGVPAVILLPALREEATVAALGALGEWVARTAAWGPRRWWQAPRMLPRAVRSMQEAIAECYTDREAAIELALDVCVYTAGEIDLGVRRGTADDPRALQTASAPGRK